MINNCKYCNKIFDMKNKNNIFCSSICREKFNKNVSTKNFTLCLLCNSSKNIRVIHFHHIIPKHIDVYSKETIPLCKNHHILIHKFLTYMFHKNYIIKKLKKHK